VSWSQALLGQLQSQVTPLVVMFIEDSHE
jgi:hypothetical protein